jgi:transcriptional regulator with XRE-family HTH domain
MTISPNQAKTARRLIGWTVSVLGGKSGLSGTTVSHFENGKRRPSALNVSKIRKVFEEGGVEFAGGGVKLRKPNEHHRRPS